MIVVTLPGHYYYRFETRFIQGCW